MEWSISGHGNSYFSDNKNCGTKKKMSLKEK